MTHTILTPSEVLAQLRISRSTLQRLTDADKIQHYTVGGQLRFTQAAIDEYLESVSSRKTRSIGELQEDEYQASIKAWADERGLELSRKPANVHALLGRPQSTRDAETPRWIRDIEADILDHALLFTRGGQPKVLLSHPYARAAGDVEGRAVRVGGAIAYAQTYGLDVEIDDPADDIYPIHAPETMSLRFTRPVPSLHS